MLQRVQKLDDILLSYTNVLKQHINSCPNFDPKKNPISKSIRNSLGLENLGIVANVKTLSLTARCLFALFYSSHHPSTLQTPQKGAMPQVRGTKNSAPRAPTSSWVYSTFGTYDFHLFRQVQAVKMKRHFSKATVICPQNSEKQ